MWQVDITVELNGYNPLPIVVGNIFKTYAMHILSIENHYLMGIIEYTRKTKVIFLLKLNNLKVPPLVIWTTHY
jgi:hypothetical protein